jgi:hypothetical protein
MTEGLWLEDFVAFLELPEGFHSALWVWAPSRRLSSEGGGRSDDIGDSLQEVRG